MRGGIGCCRRPPRVSWPRKGCPARSLNGAARVTAPPYSCAQTHAPWPRMGFLRCSWRRPRGGAAQ
eukprot:3247406-Pyramimonas_sp.AAC.1